MRAENRKEDELREIKVTKNFTKYAEGSVLIEFGNTKVICNASIDETVPPFLRGKGEGWVTAEYSMIPRATHTRNQREASREKQTGRTQEIQRLIGRSLRAVVDMKLLGERTITIDCDVIQADGGTRTASITGGYIALVDAVNTLIEKKLISKNPIKEGVAAISVGIVDGLPLLDLDYKEDSTAFVDMNFVVTESLRFVEVQGTAEGEPFTVEEMDKLRDLAIKGIKELILIQKR